MYLGIYVHMQTHIGMSQLLQKESVDLKERKEECGGGFGGMRGHMEIM